MAVYVTCPKCKKQVPFGRLFCTFCGEKLDLTADTVSNREGGRAILDRVKRLVFRLLFLGVVAGIIGLFLWPIAPTGTVGSEAHARLCQQRMQAVRARVLNGTLFSDAFSESEVNAELRDRVNRLGNTGAGFALADVNLAFLPGLVIVNTRLSWNVLDISYEIECVPSLGPNNTFVNEVRAVRIGHMPMPSFAHAFFADRALNVFSDMRNEEELLKRMRRFEVVQDQVRISN